MNPKNSARLDPALAMMLTAGGVGLPANLVPCEGFDEMVSDLKETLRLMRSHPRHEEFLQLRREGKLTAREFVRACLSEGDA